MDYPVNSTSNYSFHIFNPLLYLLITHIRSNDSDSRSSTFNPCGKPPGKISDPGLTVPMQPSLVIPTLQSLGESGSKRERPRKKKATNYRLFVKYSLMCVTGMMGTHGRRHASTLFESSNGNGHLEFVLDVGGSGGSSNVRIGVELLRLTHTSRELILRTRPKAEYAAIRGIRIGR